MSKKTSYLFHGTIGDIVDLINSLPEKPDAEFLKEWTEFIVEAAKGRSNSREFYHNKTKLRIRFDLGVEGKPGFRGKDHYHVYNPNMGKTKVDRYLDKNGNPVAKDSNPSHILPQSRR